MVGINTVLDYTIVPNPVHTGGSTQDIVIIATLKTTTEFGQIFDESVDSLNMLCLGFFLYWHYHLPIYITLLGLVKYFVDLWFILVGFKKQSMMLFKYLFFFNMILLLCLAIFVSFRTTLATLALALTISSFLIEIILAFRLSPKKIENHSVA